MHVTVLNCHMHYRIRIIGNETVDQMQMDVLKLDYSACDSSELSHATTNTGNKYETAYPMHMRITCILQMFRN